MTSAPRAAARWYPAITAAPTPWFRSSCTRSTLGSRTSRTTLLVASALPSSTTTTCLTNAGTLVMTSATVVAARYAGTTTATTGSSIGTTGAFADDATRKKSGRRTSWSAVTASATDSLGGSGWRRGLERRASDRAAAQLRARSALRRSGRVDEGGARD